ncbi:conserved hypothetical protein [Ricinus communis]|uniref:F-box associated beta-propeller type 3 domain-containing protein n=1 Tax=Ricinus communis TaxID=3988 RepID=B9SEG0_RICCO|nr:conserved hypothetical protein [Ricinus communis]
MSDSQFIVQNAMRNKSELLIQVPTHHKSPMFSIKSPDMDDKELDYSLNYFYTPQMPRSFYVLPRIGRISSSCNGVLLVNNTHEDGWLYVINLVTKCHIILPPCPTNCPHKACGSAVGFYPRSKQYKVVHIYADGVGIELFALASSNNAWKLLPGPFLEDPDGRPYDVLSNFHWNDPVLVDGRYMHWYVESNRYIISMDVSEEKSVKTYLPNHGLGMKKGAYALSELGGKLSCIINVDHTKIDVWILKNFHKQHKQEKGLTCMYNIKSKKMKQFKMQMKRGQKSIPHRNSLVSWKFKEDLLPI